MPDASRGRHMYDVQYKRPIACITFVRSVWPKGDITRRLAPERQKVTQICVNRVILPYLCVNFRKESMQIKLSPFWVIQIDAFIFSLGQPFDIALTSSSAHVESIIFSQTSSSSEFVEHTTAFCIRIQTAVESTCLMQLTIANDKLIEKRRGQSYRIEFLIASTSATYIKCMAFRCIFIFISVLNCNVSIYNLVYYMYNIHIYISLTLVLWLQFACVIKPYAKSIKKLIHLNNSFLFDILPAPALDLNRRMTNSTHVEGKNSCRRCLLVF